MTYCRPMLAAGEKMMAYNFSGYWKDVGTIRKPVGSQTWICSIPNVPLELNDNDWKIYARNQALPPQYIAATANVQNSIISRKAANVYGTVDFSVVSSDVYIGTRCRACAIPLLCPGARIEEGAVVQYAIVATGSVVGGRIRRGPNVPENMENKEDWGVAVCGTRLPAGS